MFKPEDFELPLEAHLKLRVMTDEVNNCNDVEQLREQLLASAKLLMNYQHILNRILREQITKDIGSIGLLEGDAS
jgi:hypothetical protein